MAPSLTINTGVMCFGGATPFIDCNWALLAVERCLLVTLNNKVMVAKISYINIVAPPKMCHL